MINDILIKLKNGDINIYEYYEYLSQLGITLLNLNSLNTENINELDKLLKICNIIYNNTDLEYLPIEDGLYDLLVELYKRYTSTIPIGGEVIQFPSTDNQYIQQSREVVKFHNNEVINDSKFIKDMKNISIDERDYIIKNPIHICNAIEKRRHDTVHEHPDLIGTLEKAKFVYIKDAKNLGVDSNPNVTILERDFFQKHITNGIINEHDKYTLVLELKYDGISVEADCSNVVISARSRGDTAVGVASDMTPILEGYSFPKSSFISQSFGIKFEAIMTYSDLYKFNALRNKNYKNCRSAIVGLFSASDAYKFRDFITLIPLQLDQHDENKLNRLEEINFLNNYYSSNNQPLRYAVITGNYIELLEQIKIFLDEMSYMRNYFNFMYDGIVISYIDNDVKKALGRKNFINLYSIALKFEPLKKQTIFRKYEFTVGKDGTITPMIYYDPIEFYGTIHFKSSGHSLARFNELNLRIGDIIEVQYTNDVMPYVIGKLDNYVNIYNTNPIVQFISNCPICGNPLEISKSGKTAICKNINCNGRKLAISVDMLSKLGIQDFGESRIKEIGKLHLYELMELSKDDLIQAGLGPVESSNFLTQINNLKNNNIYDYIYMGALGFTGIALRKWRIILNVFSISDIYYIYENKTLQESLVHIKGIGPVTASIINNEFEYYKSDIIFIMNLPNVITTKGLTFGKIIRFSGVRDINLEELLTYKGHDCDGNASVTKNTDILIVPNGDYRSPKTEIAKTIGALIIPIDEFIENLESYL